MDLRLPATEAPTLPGLTESERIGDAYAVVGLDARRQVVGLFRPALDRLGAVTNAALADRKPGPGPDRRPRRHPPAPDDRQGHGLPRPRGRDRDGQRHALAGHLGPAPGRRPPPRAAARRRRPPARVVGRQRDRPRRPAAGRGRRDGRRAGSARRASGSSAMPGCADWADAGALAGVSGAGRGSGGTRCFFGTLPSGRLPRGRARPGPAGSGWRGAGSAGTRPPRPRRTRPTGRRRTARWSGSLDEDVLGHRRVAGRLGRGGRRSRCRTGRAKAIAWKPTEARAVSTPTQLARARREEAGEERRPERRRDGEVLVEGRGQRMSPEERDQRDRQRPTGSAGTRNAGWRSSLGSALRSPRRSSGRKDERKA